MVASQNRLTKRMNRNARLKARQLMKHLATGKNTMPGSCRRHGVNFFDYLKDLFTCLPTAKITQIKEFTPASWAKAKQQEVAQAA